MGAGGSSQQSSRGVSRPTAAGRNVTVFSPGLRDETARNANPRQVASEVDPTYIRAALCNVGEVLPVTVHHLEAGQMLTTGIGMVIEGSLSAGHSMPPPPPEVNKAETVFGWFVEDLERPSIWEPYPKESSDRLEDAFQSLRTTCTVVMKKRTYTVNLQTMQQTATASAANADTHPAQQQQRTRAVKRAPVVPYTDPETGELRTREAPLPMGDPFADEESNNEESDNIFKGAGDIFGADAYGVSITASAAGDHLPHLVRTVLPHHSPIYTMECTPALEQLCPEARAVVEPAGGALILSSGHDMQLLEWSLETSTLVTRYTLSNTAPRNSVLTANYSSTGKLIVAGLDDNTARLYTIGHPNEIHTLRGHTHKVYGAGVLPGDLQAVTASMDRKVKLWDIERGICTRTVEAHNSHIFSLRPHPNDPNFALSAGEDCKVYMHDFRLEGSVAALFIGHRGTIWDIDWNPVCNTFASCGIDRRVCIFDPRVSTTAVETLHTHSHPVHSVKYTPRGRGLLSSSKSPFVCLHDTTNWGVQWQAKAHAGTVFRVRCHTTKPIMMTASSDASVNLWKWGALEHF